MRVEVTRINKWNKDGRSGAYASVDLVFMDDAIERVFVINGLSIATGKKGLFVGVPQTKKDDKYYDVVTPDSGTYFAIRDAVLAAYADPNFKGRAPKPKNPETPSNANTGNKDNEFSSNEDEDIPF